MTETIDIKVTKIKESKLPGVDFDNIPFGRIYTDHMFMADYKDGKWQNFEILPYGPLELDPATTTLHYAQSIFEGLKAYKSESGETLVFRPFANFERLNKSAERMCIPEVPKELYEQGMRALLEIDNDWIPNEVGKSLYIRPFVFGTDDFIGIRPSDNYKFIIITCPVGSYYAEPVSVKIETHFTRAAKGGVGYAKTAGNYAASLYPAKLAAEEGYQQLIWTDGKEHKYIEESGTMNIMFRIDDTLITPHPGDSVLPGITRDSVLKLARDWGVKVEERKISVEEVVKAAQEGRIQEAFGTGTAATIAHIKKIGYEGANYELPPISEREWSNKFLRELDMIKYGQAEDKFGWNYKL
ncbi:branched-chain amino acid aminotransferase [Mangrovivirga sp. M17]|uniref:branched-chain-amino-acid transaminase n=1 Tax=Mangrovivirga halotolerans TaxID=2993936 RepID=A0ABT3RNK7_9BACT|nr:branched-chain amino acid aminotransferase [Mangrovivirga halotolerans]MCX2743387.1 branched-chain amino acid aminotransferase [Mangrovivirga halotolerans]